MFANSLARGPKRRGIVLVLILGMLGLLALIGVTFATYAGQAVVNAKNFSISEGRSSAEAYMDFALGQLINDTNNPLSAIRGHSLLRDMYGNDSVFRGTTAADYGGLLSSITQPGGATQALQFQSAGRPYSQSTTQLTPALGVTASPNPRPVVYYQYLTNIPTASISYQYYGLNFTRWIVKVQNVYTNGQLTGLSQTFEVLEDDDTGQDKFSGGYHLLTLGPIDTSTRLYNSPIQEGYPGDKGTKNDPVNGTKTQVSLTPPYIPALNAGAQFVLDGRFMNAFNGPGLSRPLVPYAGGSGVTPFPPLVPFNVAAYANFRVNSSLINPTNDLTSTASQTFPSAIGSGNPPATTTFGNPDLIGMDEDYDACDLENWFLALQSADGQVMIPSFHRPSILTSDDWTKSLKTATTLKDQMNAVAGIAKILRPRLVDNSPQFPPDPILDSTTGKYTYDVDNDGDGQTDSVWLDLGYPVQKNAGGKLFKPLFAFMVIGQNGRLPLNTVGNLQDRDSQSSVTYYAKNPGVPAPNNYVDASGNTVEMGTPVSQANAVQQFATAATYLDAPTWDHTSHVGASVNEINPKYALQNAPANVYNLNVNNINNGVGKNAVLLPTLGDVNGSYYSQVDYSPANPGITVGIDVALTQLRNLLAGTVPMDNLKNPNPNYTQEGNAVLVKGQNWWMPNGVLDPGDPNYSGGSQPTTSVPPVAGRWGEPEGVPKQLGLTGTIFQSLYATQTPKAAPFNSYVYNNPVRAGKSYFNSAPNAGTLTSYQYTSDNMDDDSDSSTGPIGGAVAEAVTTFYDAAGQVAIPSQRLRRFSTPMDTSGNGQLITWMIRPNDIYSPFDATTQTGPDHYGRVNYFRYFRPPGLPQEITYSYVVPSYSMLTPSSQYYVDIYNMPAFTGYAQPNTTNNQYHSFESFRAPAPNNSTGTYTFNDLANIAVVGAMPFDYQGTTTAPTSPQLWLNSGSNPSQNTYALGSGNSAPFVTNTSSASGPWFVGLGSTVPTPLNPPMPPPPYAYIPAENGPYLDNSNNPGVALVANSYPLGSLNKDEADEMNLYSPNRYDQQFGPSDLEWLYRLQDVDGSTLNSRLSSLAPISFLNPADGQTRRRLFSLESWEPNNFVWANDNPLVFNTAAYLNNLTSATPLAPFNSRFSPYANASFANLNQVVSTDPVISHYANVNSVEVLPNPLLDAPIISNSAFPNDVTVNPDPDYGQGNANYVYNVGNNQSMILPATMTPIAMLTYPFTAAEYTQFFFNSVTGTVNNAAANGSSPYYPNLINGQAGIATGTNTNSAAYPVNTPALAHRDRRINLNMPLPVANDPAEPVRQKWCRETYQMLKAILPPQSIDTPQELAALSQFVVNIIDFRDPDSTMTRFVNTDLMIVPPSAPTTTGGVSTSTTTGGVKFAEIPIPDPTSGSAVQSGNIIDPITGAGHYFYPFDPFIATEQTNPSPGWITFMTEKTGSGASASTYTRPLYLVQYGMEYNPIAINEVLAYSFFSTNMTTAGQTNNYLTPRFYVELVNTLADDSSHAPLLPGTAYPGPFPQATGTGGTATVGSGDLSLVGWDFIITPDTDARGRPDPTTGTIPAVAGLIAGPAYEAVAGTVDVTKAGRIDNLPTTAATTVPATASATWPNTVLPALPPYSFGWSLDSNYGLWVPPPPTSGTPALTLPDGMSTPVNANGQVSYIPALRAGGPQPNSNGYGWPVAPGPAGQPAQVIGDGYFVIGASPVFQNNAVDRITALQTTASVNSFADFLFPNQFFVDLRATALTQPAGGTAPPAGTVTLPPGNQYYWLYLRRPANPFNPSQEMVVVDSFRFPFIVNKTQGQTVTGAKGTPVDTYYSTTASSLLPASVTPPTSKPNEIFSLQRLQPYRGGHHVAASVPAGDGSTATSVTIQRPPGHVWGYTEQTATVPSGTTTTPPATTAAYGGNPPATSGSGNSSTTYFDPAGMVYDTMGYANNPNDGSGSTQNWDYFPFHDRDFNSVAELMLVPGCPPGLFTKLFAEQNFNFQQAANVNTTTFPTATGTTQFDRSAVVSDPQLTYPHAFPYLTDKFYYTAVSVNPSVDPGDGASVGPYPTQLGGWTGTGWYKMFDFFEVPSSALGAIGTTDAGENFDWFRQDRRPGLLNLNLIIDEEVFFGLLDDPRTNMALAQYGYYLNNLNLGYGVGDLTPVSPIVSFPQRPAAATLPQIISQVDYYGNPAYYYSISDVSHTSNSVTGATLSTGAGSGVTSLAPGGLQLQVANTGTGPPTVTGTNYLLNTQVLDPNGNIPPIYPNRLAIGRGFTYADPAFSYAGVQQNTITGMKAAFADFLKLRSGGTNFLFGHQAPSAPPGMLALVMDGSPMTLNTTYGTSVPNFNNVWPDKPYHSLSYPDINYTVMRPATPVPPITITSGVTVVPPTGGGNSTINGTATNPTLGVSPLTFPPPYQYQLDPALTFSTSPIQSLTLTALGYGNPNQPTNASSPASTYILDPGIRFPWMDLTFTNMTNYNSAYTKGLGTPQIPPIAPRRLFQPPDVNPTTTPSGAAVSNGDMATTVGDLTLNGAGALTSNFLADPYYQLIPTRSTPSAVANPSSVVPSVYPLSAYVTGGASNNFTPQPPNTTAYNPSLMAINGGPYLGSNYVQQNFDLTNNRQHPYFRTELLQKVMNLTTVRTHQFAVWITVGFFEVVQTGTPELGIPDVLGAEVDAAAGRNVRYRSFFVIDRTKAAGFNPYYPGEFRNCVTYRRRIE